MPKARIIDGCYATCEHPVQQSSSSRPVRGVPNGRQTSRRKPPLLTTWLFAFHANFGVILRKQYTIASDTTTRLLPRPESHLVGGDTRDVLKKPRQYMFAVFADFKSAINLLPKDSVSHRGRRLLKHPGSSKHVFFLGKSMSVYI